MAAPSRRPSTYRLRMNSSNDLEASRPRLFPLRGLWQSGRQVLQDRVVVFSVMDFTAQTEFERIHYLERLKARLKRKLDQLDILITVQELVSI